jgi:hypothetical protein
MFSTDSSIWNVIKNLSHNLGVKEDTIIKAKQDFNKLFTRWKETQSEIKGKYKSEKIEKTLSWSNFYSWRDNFFCFFLLYLSGFRHTAIRELRFYLEASSRSYYIDTRHQEMPFNCKVSILKEVRRKRFIELLKGLPKKRKEFKSFYDTLCDYVHLSEEAQTDATRDFGFNIALGLRFYEEDIKMLEKTFKLSSYLLLHSLDKPVYS